MNTLYEKYMEAQKEYPQAVIVRRLGDFFEVMGEKAKIVADALDITLTGRDVGLAERVPMCGFPYHICEEYIEKILKEHSVVVVEDGEEPQYILSHKEVNGETEDDDEVVDIDFDEEFDDEEEEKRPVVKDTSKRMSERKKPKQNLQISLFDFEVKEPTKEEKLKEWVFSRGSGFYDGKYRIYEKYLTDPTENEFANFLKKEYGTGGGYTEYAYSYDSKGYTVQDRAEDFHTVLCEVFMTWKEMAYGIADFIDKEKYFKDDE